MSKSSAKAKATAELLTRYPGFTRPFHVELDHSDKRQTIKIIVDANGKEVKREPLWQSPNYGDGQMHD